MAQPPKARKQAKTVAVGFNRLPRAAHGKQGVCRGLPPVAGGPLPEKEGVDPLRRSTLCLAAAVRAWALVTTAAGACLEYHASILIARWRRGQNVIAQLVA